MGRTNKLVDGCYSFWQGGIFPLLRMLMPDYLAQTHIPTMPRLATAPGDDSMEPSNRGVGSSGQAAVSSGQGAASSGQGAGGSGQDATGSEASAGQASSDADGRLGPESSVSEDVMNLEGQDPVVRALNDLHRTKVRSCGLWMLCLFLVLIKLGIK